ncbi:Poly(rC)-binding protein 3 [Homalodisca vitripennis]|nr:Poly(rC)-binding protein 3 [Homalodisca vitripennis]
MQNGGGGGGGPRPPITLRLIVSPQLFSSIIGHCGTNIKEIRKVTGAKIWMLNEMLPNSTEKIVSITGTSEIITQCILHICCIMLEWPPKEFTIPYYPRPSFANPIIFAKGQAYTIQGNYAVPFNGKSRGVSSSAWLSPCLVRHVLFGCYPFCYPRGGCDWQLTPGSSCPGVLA